MKYLIYGAGTIGITYAWILSQKHDVDILVKPERYEKLSQGINLAVKDLRNHSAIYEDLMFVPKCITAVTGKYDGILVTVNRYQLQDILPELSQLKNHTGYFAFMQNSWDIQAELSAHISDDMYIIAFPSSVGGGRENNRIESIIFDEATRIGGRCKPGMKDLQCSLEQAGIKIQVDNRIFDWLKVHYLQQSITAGAILEKGDFISFANDYQAVKKMVKAFREGIAVCRSHGIPTNRIFPSSLFRLPVSLVAHTMQKMFLEQNTMEMVNNHMKKGLPEWIVGYKEVLSDGLQRKLPMTVWKSYDAAIEKYLNANKQTY